MSTNSSVQIIIHISKLLKKKTVLNKHMQINDTRILGVLQNWEYYILLRDISFQFFYNAGNIQEYGWWVLPAISLCMRIDNVFFVIRLRLCNSLFPWHFSVVNCLSTAPSSISLDPLIMLHCNSWLSINSIKTVSSLSGRNFLWMNSVAEWDYKELSG